MMLKLKSRIGPKGQVVIPKPIRDCYGLGPGKVVYFTTKEDEIQIQRGNDAEILERFFNAFEKIDLPPAEELKRLYYSQFDDEISRYKRAAGR